MPQTYLSRCPERCIPKYSDCNDPLLAKQSQPQKGRTCLRKTIYSGNHAMSVECALACLAAIGGGRDIFEISKSWMYDTGAARDFTSTEKCIGFEDDIVTIPDNKLMELKENSHATNNFN